MMRATLNLVVDPKKENLDGCGCVDWSFKKGEFGPVVHVGKKQVNFRTPELGFGNGAGRYRTTWILMTHGKWGGKWTRVENEVDGTLLGTPNGFLPELPSRRVITIFSDRKRREMCLDSVPEAIKKKQKSESVKVRRVAAVSSQKRKRMLEKEVPYDQIPPEQQRAYRDAESKEWEAWKKYETVVSLRIEESERIRREKPDKIVRSRMVYRDKHAGMLDDQGKNLPLKAKARLCALGQFAPGVVEALTPVDSPTFQRISTFYFLHCVVSWGWLSSWKIGDVSNAFLQGEMPDDQDCIWSNLLGDFLVFKRLFCFDLGKVSMGYPKHLGCGMNLFPRSFKRK